MTLSGIITPGQSGPGSNGNKRELRISQNSSIYRTSPPNYSGHSLRDSYPFAEIQSVYSTASAVCARNIGI